MEESATPPAPKHENGLPTVFAILLIVALVALGAYVVRNDRYQNAPKEAPSTALDS